MRIAIIIPVYNEIETIGEITKKVLGTAYEKEVIIVDDGSTDGTKEFLMQNFKERQDLKVYFHQENQGKTAAIRTAIKHVTADVVIIQDGDLEYDPSDYGRLLEPIIKKQTEVVYGSRFLNVHRYLFVYHWFLNKFLGRHYEIKYLSHFLGIQFLNLLTHLLYGIRISDIATGYKVFKTEVIKGIRLETNRFEFCYEITAKLAKRRIKITEVPIDYHPRSNLKGKKITWEDGIWASWALIKYRFKD